MGAKCSKEEFSLFWAKLTAGYPRMNTSPGTLIRYYERLRRFTQRQLLRAADMIADEHEYFPTPAEIIKVIKRDSQAVPPQKLLDEPRPSPEQIEKNRKMLWDIINGLGKKQGVK